MFCDFKCLSVYLNPVRLNIRLFNATHISTYGIGMPINHMRDIDLQTFSSLEFPIEIPFFSPLLGVGARSDESQGSAFEL